MLTKYAEAQVIQASRGVMRPSAVRVAGRRTAHRAVFDYTPREGFIYVRSRAISSRCNDNFDEFPAAEIKQAYRTFVGKPVFVNHHNDDHRRARGVIIDAVLHEDVNPDGSPDTWAEVLMEVDAVKFPKLAKAILAGHIDRTSMGTDVAYSICSVCANKAATPMDYCKHIPAMKGQMVYRTTASGTKEPTLVREVCYGLSFFENSLLVEDPADPTAFFLGVDDRGVSGGYEGNLKEASETRRMRAVAAREGSGHAREGIRRQALRQHDERRDFGAARSPVRFSSAVRQGGTRVHRRGVRLTRTAIGGGKLLVTRNAKRLAASLPQDARSAIYRVTKKFMRGEIAADKMQSPRRKYYHLHAYANGGIYIIGIEDRGDHDAVIWVGTHEDANKRFYKQISRGGGLRMAANRRRVAYGETVAPQEVDTMREEECPVCGNDDNYDGEQCQVCGYITPPEEFQDPDLSKARDTDLRNGVMPEGDEDEMLDEMGDDEMLEEGVPSDPEDAALLAEVNEVLEEVKQMLAPDGEAGQSVQDEVRQQLDDLRQVMEMTDMGGEEGEPEGDEGVPVEGETMDDEDVDQRPFGADGEDEGEEEGAEEEGGEEDLPEFMTSEDGDEGEDEADDEDEDDEDEEEDEDGRPVRRAKSAREGVSRRVSKERGMPQGRRRAVRRPVSRAVSRQRVTSGHRKVARSVQWTEYTDMTMAKETIDPYMGFSFDVGNTNVSGNIYWFGPPYGDSSKGWGYTIGAFRDGKIIDEAEGILPRHESSYAAQRRAENELSGFLARNGLSASATRRTAVKYPEVNVRMVGEDGNAFSILGRVTNAMRRAGISKEEIDLFREEATSGDYDNLLRTVMSWVSIDAEDEYDSDAEWDEYWADADEGRYSSRKSPARRRTNRSNVRSTPRRVASRTRTTKDTKMNSTLKTLAEVKKLLADVKRNQRSVQAQVSYIGRAAGLERQLASLQRRADAENPAQPVPEPAPVAPAMTTEEARDHTPVDLMTPGGSDVPGEGVPEDYRVDLTQPGGVHDVPLTDGGDVTAPVEGTTEQRPYEETVTNAEVKTRDLDTEVAYEESQPLFGGEAEKEARFVAALRLARLRIKAGIASGDDLAVATSIAESRMSATAIRNETNTLEAVAKAGARQPSAPSRTARRLVPQAARTAPSFRTEAAVNTAPEAPLAVTGDEFLWD